MDAPTQPGPPPAPAPSLLDAAAPGPWAATAHRFTLRFADPVLEGDYRGDLQERTLRSVRDGYLLAIAMYGGFGVLDLHVIPEALGLAWLVRFALVCPLAAGILAWSYRPSGPPRLQGAGAIFCLVAGAGIVAMIASASGPGRDLYYAGLLLVLAFTYTFLRLRFALASLASWGFTALYLAAVAAGPALPFATGISHLFFLVGANIIGMTACWTLERSARQDYLQRRLIAAQAASLSEALGSVKVLSGLLPICAWCHKVRQDDGYWQQIEAYLSARTDAEFTHGICPECQPGLESRRA